jgi:hypothetical protein
LSFDFALALALAALAALELAAEEEDEVPVPLEELLPDAEDAEEDEAADAEALRCLVEAEADAEEAAVDPLTLTSADTVFAAKNEVMPKMAIITA